MLRAEPGLVYDRELLLFGVKRQAVLDLWEVQRYGADSFGDPDRVSVYGLPPADWYARGLRLLGRTTVECAIDRLSEAIANDVAALAASAPPTSATLVIDPFAGSGNTLFWLQRRLPGSTGLGFELDAGVFALTRQNLAAISAPIELVNVDYSVGLAGVAAPPDALVVVFVGPPWGDAFGRIAGLDLSRTTPPVAEIVDALAEHFAGTRLLLAIQTYETVEPVSLADVRSRCNWSAHHVYHLNEAGRNPGALLATLGWTPR